MELLAALRSLPADAEVTIAVRVGDLAQALEERDERPDRLVSTEWCSERWGRSPEWWATECREGRVADAIQERPGAPWEIQVRSAEERIRVYREERSQKRGRRRGPRSQKSGELLPWRATG